MVYANGDRYEGGWVHDIFVKGVIQNNEGEVLIVIEEMQDHEENLSDKEQEHFEYDKQ